ncbi:hypothetical protein EJB05_24743, partial [Eragrostis curvula]
MRLSSLFALATSRRRRLPILCAVTSTARESSFVACPAGSVVSSAGSEAGEVVEGEGPVCFFVFKFRTPSEAASPPDSASSTTTSRPPRSSSPRTASSGIDPIISEVVVWYK